MIYAYLPRLIAALVFSGDIVWRATTTKAIQRDNSPSPRPLKSRWGAVGSQETGLSTSEPQKKNMRTKKNSDKQ